MSAHERVAGQPGIAFICLWTGVLNAAATAPLSPALPAIARELGGTLHGSFVAQMIQTVSAVGMIAGAGLAGYASERIGRRAVMLLGAMLLVAAGTAGLFLADIGALAASRMITGMSSGAMLATSYAIVGEHFAGAARNRILGYCGGAGAFATLAFLLVAGLMVDRFGWRSVFTLYLLGLVIVPFVLVSMRPGTAPRREAASLGWMPILMLWPLWLVQVGFAIGVYMSVIQVPFIAAAKGIANASTIGLLVAMTSVSATIIALCHGRLRQWLDVRGMFALIALSFGAGLLVCAIANDLPAFVIGTVLLGLGAGSLEPTIVSRALHDIPEPLHDRAAGTAISTLFLGQFLNPVVVYPMAAIGGPTFAAGSYGLVYLVIGLAIVLVAIARPIRAAGVRRIRPLRR